MMRKATFSPSFSFALGIYSLVRTCGHFCFCSCVVLRWCPKVHTSDFLRHFNQYALLLFFLFWSFPIPLILLPIPSPTIRTGLTLLSSVIPLTLLLTLLSVLVLTFLKIQILLLLITLRSFMNVDSDVTAFFFSI